MMTFLSLGFELTNLNTKSTFQTRAVEWKSHADQAGGGLTKHVNYTIARHF